MQSPGNRIICRSADMPACGSRDGLVGIGDCNGVGNGIDHGQIVIAKAESNLSIASYNKAVVGAVNDVARAASQVQTLAEKNQHQAQIERDALRVVGLAQARFNAGIIAGSRVSEARIPALRERANGLLLQGQWLDASIQLTGALGGGYKR